MRKDTDNKSVNENMNYSENAKSDDGTIHGKFGQEYTNEHPVFFPFGPPVYLDKMNEDVIRELDVLIEQLSGSIEYDASGQLAGRIKKQTMRTQSVTHTIEESIIMHCNRFFKMTQDTPNINMPGYGRLDMQISSIWSNIQEAREYNPPHTHTGDLSFVIYCRNDLEKYSLDQLQNNEYDSPHQEDDGGTSQYINTTLAGLIELQYGEPNWLNWTQFRHVPSRGDIIIFPNWLRHTVYAHYEANHVRISVAGNVNILNIDRG